MREPRRPVHVERQISYIVSAAERRFAWVRIGFCAVVFLVFLLHADYRAPHLFQRFACELSVVVVGILISVWAIVACRHRVLERRDMYVATAGDAIVCLGALFVNGYLPAEDYGGVFASLDVAVVLVILLVSLLRASSRVILFAALLHALGLTLIAAFDVRQGLAVPWQKVSLFAAFFIGAVALGLFITNLFARTLLMVVGATSRAERARSSLFALLHDHHDFCSVLCDIRLNFDRAFERSHSEAREASLLRVSERLSVLGELFERTRHRALTALRGADSPSPCRPNEVLSKVTAEFVQSGVDIVLDAPQDVPPVLVGGGAVGLELLVVHLISNALKGDGNSGATRVELAIRQRPDGYVEVRVEDDGPGIAPAVLKRLNEARQWTAPLQTTGLGLWLATQSIEAAGGRFSVRAHKRSRGTLIEMLLPTV